MKSLLLAAVAVSLALILILAATSSAAIVNMAVAESDGVTDEFVQELEWLTYLSFIQAQQMIIEEFVGQCNEQVILEGGGRFDECLSAAEDLSERLGEWSIAHPVVTDFGGSSNN